ncbi:Uncharacterised protein [Klebsiella pneumoniae]|nr:Uncharacterised protein [Klebsiella pneumoniae]
MTSSSFVKNNPTNAIMYGPKYPLNWLYSDGSLSHLDNWGKVLQGEYQEQAIFWAFIMTPRVKAPGRG